MIKVFHTEKEELVFDFLEKQLEKVFKENEKVAIKLHMGEPGNKFFIRPEFVKTLIDLLKKLHTKPFLFDSPVTYRSPRNNVKGYLKVAHDHGYSEKTIGAPVVISNKSIKTEGKNLSYEICKDLVEADGVIILSHVKGHIASGFGGAIKNLAMGAMSKETKNAIHEGGEPIYTEGCVQCGACVEQCPTGNIILKNNKPFFGKTWCSGCSNCVLVCPENAIKPRVAIFDELLAEASAKAYEKFKKSYSINVLKNITRLCDCMPKAGPIIADDMGFMCSENPLTVDMASLDFIKEKTGSPDIFAEVNKKSAYEHINRAKKYFEEGKTYTLERMD